MFSLTLGYPFQPVGMFGAISCQQPTRAGTNTISVRIILSWAACVWGGCQPCGTLCNFQLDCTTCQVTVTVVSDHVTWHPLEPSVLSILLRLSLRKVPQCCQSLNLIAVADRSPESGPWGHAISHSVSGKHVWLLPQWLEQVATTSNYQQKPLNPNQWAVQYVFSAQGPCWPGGAGSSKSTIVAASH